MNQRVPLGQLLRSSDDLQRILDGLDDDDDTIPLDCPNPSCDPDCNVCMGSGMVHVSSAITSLRRTFR